MDKNEALRVAAELFYDQAAQVRAELLGFLVRGEADKGQRTQLRLLDEASVPVVRWLEEVTRG